MTKYDLNYANNLLGKRIIELCNLNDVSIYKVTKDTKLSKDTLRSVIVSDELIASIDTLVKVAKYFNVRINDLLKYVIEEEEKNDK